MGQSLHQNVVKHPSNNRVVECRSRALCSDERCKSRFGHDDAHGRPWSGHECDRAHGCQCCNWHCEACRPGQIAAPQRPLPLAARPGEARGDRPTEGGRSGQSRRSGDEAPECGGHEEAHGPTGSQHQRWKSTECTDARGTGPQRSKNSVIRSTVEEGVYWANAIGRNFPWDS